MLPNLRYSLRMTALADVSSSLPSARLGSFLHIDSKDLENSQNKCHCHSVNYTTTAYINQHQLTKENKYLHNLSCILFRNSHWKPTVTLTNLHNMTQFTGWSFKLITVTADDASVIWSSKWPTDSTMLQHWTKSSKHSIPRTYRCVTDVSK